MEIRERISQSLENELQGYCKKETKKMIRCNQCYKRLYRRCEE